MESLNKTSSGQSRRVPISPRREDSRFPPLHTGPRVPVLVQELGSEKRSCYEGDLVIGTPGTGSFPPTGSLCAKHCACFICTFMEFPDGYFYSILRRRELRFEKVKGFVQGHTALLLLSFLLECMSPC